MFTSILVAIAAAIYFVISAIKGPGVKRPSIENRPIASRSQYPSSGVKGLRFPE